MFDFRNLDEKTRGMMLQEVFLDEQNNNIYISPRLNSHGENVYINLLRDAIRNGTDSELAFALNQNNCFKLEENRNTKTGNKMVKIPYNANETLAEGEFNRFYIRGLCLRAIDEQKKLQIYRAKQVSHPRSQSQLLVGNMVNPINTLNDLRTNQGIDASFGLPPGPNSGLCVELI